MFLWSEIMSERFSPKCNFQKCAFVTHIKDNEQEVVLDIHEIVALLNTQQDTISQLERELEKIPKSIREVWLE